MSAALARLRVVRPVPQFRGAWRCVARADAGAAGGGGEEVRRACELRLTSWRNLARRKQRHRCFFNETLNQPKANRRSGPEDPDTPREGAVGDGQFSK